MMFLRNVLYFQMKHSVHDINTAENEISQILHRWMRRIESCLNEAEIPRFQEVLSRQDFGLSDPGTNRNLTLKEWDCFTGALKASIPDIVLRFLSTAQLSDLGIYGYAIASASNFKDAMELSNNVFFLTAERHTQEMKINGNSASFYPRILMPEVKYQDIAEDTLAGTWQLMALLLGSQFDAGKVTVNFSYAAPSHERSYRTTFADRCFFDQSETAITFPVGWLEYPIVSAAHEKNQVVRGHFIDDFLGRENQHQQDIVSHVKRLLLTRLNRHMPGLEEAASELSMSTSQLRQKLYRVGTSYKRVVLDVRMTLAFHYLKRTQFDIQEIAYLLDYSEPAAFSRSFKKYYSESPLYWRERNSG